MPTLTTDATRIYSARPLNARGNHAGEAILTALAEYAMADLPSQGS